MKNIFLSSLFFLLFILVFSCEKTVPESDNIIYRNSFENSADIKDFEGYCVLSSDTPTGGGDSSLSVSGGCIYPDVTFELEPFNKQQQLSIRCWGKTETSGGIVMKLNNDFGSSVFISITDSLWTYYESYDTLIVPVNEKVIIELNSGGFIPGGMLIDELEIISMPVK